MDLFKTFKTDQTKEQEGIWITIDGGPTRLKIARIGNPRYRDAMGKKANRFKIPLRAQPLKEDASLAMLAELIAETILVDWEGITRDGQPYPYSVENAKQALSELKDFREMVMGFADDIENFREETKETTEVI